MIAPGRNEVRDAVRSPWTDRDPRFRLRYLEEAHRLRRMGDPSGYPWVAGIDEVGYGPLAGPVVVAAVILPRGLIIPGLDDSKKLSARARSRLYPKILELAIAVSVACEPPSRIDEIGILGAIGAAMRRALHRLRPTPNLVLVDGRNEVVGLKMTQRTVVRGDSRYASIAAASVVAKVVRDARMVLLARRHPAYAFERNKGYGTEEHRRALAQCGPCCEHRLSFIGKPRPQLSIFTGRETAGNPGEGPNP